MRQRLDASATTVTFPAPGTQTPARRDGREAAMVTTHARSGPFYGWRVVGAAFVLGAFGWGMGFFGPPVFLSVVRETRGWPLVLVSTAVSFHFLVGAVTGARLAALHRRFGAAAVTKAGALSLAAG